MKKYVVIGNGAAAVGCIEGIRSLDADGGITYIQRSWNGTSVTQTEVTEVEHGVVRPYCGIPIGDYRLIHLLYISERTVAKPDDVRMVEMRVGCEERMFCVKLEIHLTFWFTTLSLPLLEHGESLFDIC